MQTTTTTEESKSGLFAKSLRIRGEGGVSSRQAKKDTDTGVIERLVSLLSLFWAFSESDIVTFVLPNSTFGMLGGLAARHLIEGTPPLAAEIFHRIPFIIAFNWLNVFVFGLANQRSSESVKEDAINKPWRPIPSGKVTQEQTRRAMLFVVPLVFAYNYLLGVWQEGAMIQVLTWLYNDLGGGEELVRDVIIGVAYANFNEASLRIAIGAAKEGRVGFRGFAWVGIISAVITTTMHVQDLKDQDGDRTRGRKTIPLVLGDTASRVAIAVMVPMLSVVCVHFWDLVGCGWACALPLVFGAPVCYSVMLRRGVREDSQTWKMWCFWTMSLYALPLFKI